MKYPYIADVVLDDNSWKALDGVSREDIMEIFKETLEHECFHFLINKKFKIKSHIELFAEREAVNYEKGTIDLWHTGKCITTYRCSNGIIRKVPKMFIVELTHLIFDIAIDISRFRFLRNLGYRFLNFLDIFSTKLRKFSIYIGKREEFHV